MGSTSPEMKNQAFALLYRRYIAEAKVPWNIPKDNPSKIRVEKRVVDGVHDVPVIVDDFEHCAIVCGVIAQSDGKLVGTCRMLRRNDMSNGLLEVERYGTFPNEARKGLEYGGIDIEVNRWAIDNRLKNMRSILLTNYIIVSKFGGKMDNGKYIVTFPESFRKYVEDTVQMKKWKVLGSFK